MILKLLLVIGVIGIIYFLFIKKKPTQINDLKTDKDAEDMIQCQACGIYSEINESILSNGKYYCSNECVATGK